MMPNVTRGGFTFGVLQYLVGPGRENEHTNPHLVANAEGLFHPSLFAEIELTIEDASTLADSLDAYMSAFNVPVYGDVRRFNPQTQEQFLIRDTANHVWHTSLSLSPDEPKLSDEQWNAIAQDFMSEMGFNKTSTHAQAPWVAIRHGLSKNGGDHIHIVANVVRYDGTKVNLNYDWPRAQKACNLLEHKYGLAVVESREHNRGSINDSAESLNVARKQGKPLTDRAQLETRVRAAATQASSEADFVRLVQAKGVRIRPRFAKGTTSTVVGYSVALHTHAGQNTKWFGAGRLARDLSLPRLRQRWKETPHSKLDATIAWKDAWRGKAGKPATKFNADKFDQYLQAVKDAEQILRNVDPTNPVALADASQDVAGLFSVASTNWGDTKIGRALGNAGRQFGRTAQLKQRPATRNLTPSPFLALASVYAANTTRDTVARQTVLMYQMLLVAKQLAELYTQVQQRRTAEVLLRDTTKAFQIMTREIDASPLANEIRNVQRAVDDAEAILDTADKATSKQPRPTSSEVRVAWQAARISMPNARPSTHVQPSPDVLPPVVTTTSKQVHQAR